MSLFLLEFKEVLLLLTVLDEASEGRQKLEIL